MPNYRPVATYNVACKSQVRQELLAVPWTTALTLPSHEALCVQYLLRNYPRDGVPRSIVCVDYQLAVLQQALTKIKAVSKANRVRPTILLHAGELAQLHSLPRNVDLAFLDLCGPLNSDLARWLRQDLQPQLRPSATIAITLARACRSSIFMTRVRRFLARDRGSARLLRHCETLCLQARVTRKFSDDWEDFTLPTLPALQQLSALVLLFAPARLRLQKLFLYPSVNGNANRGVAMTAMQFRLQAGATTRFQAMAQRFWDQVVTREHRCDPTLIPKAINAWHANRPAECLTYWQRATVGQKSTITRLIGKSPLQLN